MATKDIHIPESELPKIRESAPPFTRMPQQSLTKMEPTANFTDLWPRKTRSDNGAAWPTGTFHALSQAPRLGKGEAQRREGFFICAYLRDR